MKKIIAIVIAASLAAFLVGCGSVLDVIDELADKETQATESPTTAPVESAAPTPQAPPETTLPEPDLPEETQTPERDYDFRNTYWGMTLSEVEQAEGGEVIDRADDWLFFFSEDVAGMSAVIAYGFENGKLANGMYMFELDHDNADAYIKDFDELKEKLTGLYGEPPTDALLWNDDQYKEDVQNYGTAVAEGQLTYIAVWETEITRITLHLRGDNNDISLTLIYDQLEDGGASEDSGL